VLLLAPIIVVVFWSAHVQEFDTAPFTLRDEPRSALDEYSRVAGPVALVAHTPDVLTVHRDWGQVADAAAVLLAK
jgi:hypothetical protein